MSTIITWGVVHVCNTRFPTLKVNVPLSVTKSYLTIKQIVFDKWRLVRREECGASMPYGHMSCYLLFQGPGSPWLSSILQECGSLFDSESLPVLMGKYLVSCIFMFGPSEHVCQSSVGVWVLSFSKQKFLNRLADFHKTA